MDNEKSEIWGRKIAFGKRVYSNTNHWKPLAPDYSLRGRPKKILVLSGNGAHSAKEANGMCKVVEEILGPSKGEYEICGFYYPEEDRNKTSVVACAEELLDKFLVPLIADKNSFGDLVRISRKEACENMRNVVMFTHCYGSRISFEVNKKLDEVMAEIGYSAEEIDDIHSQLFIAHNNNPRDDLGTTPQKSSNIYRITHADERNKPCEYECDTFPQYTIREQFTDDDLVMAKISQTEHALILGRISDGVESEHNGGYWINPLKKTSAGRREDAIFKAIFREVVFSRYHIDSLEQIEDRAIPRELRGTMEQIREYGEEFMDDFAEYRQKMHSQYNIIKQKIRLGSVSDGDIATLSEDVLFLTDENKQTLLDYAVKSGNYEATEKIWRAMSSKLRCLDVSEDLKNVYQNKPANFADAVMRHRGYLQQALDSDNVELFTALVKSAVLLHLNYDNAGERTALLAGVKYAQIDPRCSAIKFSLYEKGLNSLYARCKKMKTSNARKPVIQALSSRVSEIQHLRTIGYIYS